MAEFGPTIADAYAFEGEWLDLGRGVHDESWSRRRSRPASTRDLQPARPDRRSDRNREDATLQLLAEQLSAAGVPSWPRHEG